MAMVKSIASQSHGVLATANQRVTAPAVGAAPLFVVPAVEVADRPGDRADARLEVAPGEEREELLARAAEVDRRRARARMVADVPGVAQRRQFRERVFAVDEVRVVTP